MNKSAQSVNAEQTVLTAQDIFGARARIRTHIRHTPLEPSPSLSRLAGADVYLKLENLQRTGSFKPRGSFYRLLMLMPEERERGMIAPSAGNHGIGLAYAGAQLNIPVRIYLPEGTDSQKTDLLRSFGATVTFLPDIEAARQAAMRAAADEGFIFLSAYNDPAMIAGAGTIALEILEDLQDLEVGVVCMGGGGMAAGIGVLLKSVNPKIAVYGVQTENSPTFARWLEAGRTVEVELKPSIAVGLSGYIEPSTITFPILQRVVDRVYTVSEEELVHAMQWALETHHVMLEPSGVATLAWLLRAPRELAGRRVATIVSGGNISAEYFFRLTRR